MSSGISVYFLAIDSQVELIHAQQKVAKTQLEKIQEEFSVSMTTNETDSDRLAIQVVNDGRHIVEIADIWIINKTDSANGFPATRYTIGYSDTIIPAGYGRNILENTPLFLNQDKYDVKVISKLGTIKKSEIDLNGTSVLKAEIYTIPPDVRVGENVTVALRVTNIGDNEITNVTPFGLPQVIPPGAVVSSQLVSASSIDYLKPTETGFFTWDYKVTGTVGSDVTFSNNVTGVILDEYPVYSNTASDDITLQQDIGGEGGAIVLKDELFAKPELFMVIPNPFGDSNSKGFWGVNVVNPTNKTMSVSKVSVSALRANANDNHVIFATGCSSIEMISPASSWDCPNENTLVWKNISSPVTINPLSSYAFLAKLAPDKITGPSIGLETIVTTSSVFTSLGAFGKGPYETSMRATDEVVANVYFSDPGGSTNNADIRGSILGILSNQTKQFNVTMAELSSASPEIEEDAELIINIPKDWTFVSVDSSTGFTVAPPTIYADGSTQIVGALNADMDDETKYIQFSATAPDVSSAKMYIFHILGTGETDGSPPFSIGPIAETVVQVCATSGCP